MTMRTLPVNHGALEVEVTGPDSGEPVVLIHGSHVADAFLPFRGREELARYRLVPYHRRGFAASGEHTGPCSIEEQADDCIELLRVLGIDKAHVVGHSYGGVIALEVVQRMPGLCGSLALFEPALMGVPSGQQFFEVVGPAIDAYARGDAVAAVDGFMTVVAGPDWKRQINATVPGGPDQADRDAATFFEVELPALAQWSITPEDAGKITAPVLYLLGDASGPVFEEGCALVRRLLPQTEVEVLAGASHPLQMLDPAGAAERLAAFLIKHPLR